MGHNKRLCFRNLQRTEYFKNLLQGCGFITDAKDAVDLLRQQTALRAVMT